MRNSFCSYVGFLQNLPTNVVICEQREILKFCNFLIFKYFSDLKAYIEHKLYHFTILCLKFINICKQVQISLQYRLDLQCNKFSLI